MDLTINIDLDEKCKQCGKKGAVNGGICLTCISNNMAEGKYDDKLKQAREELRERMQRRPHSRLD